MPRRLWSNLSLAVVVLRALPCKPSVSLWQHKLQVWHLQDSQMTGWMMVRGLPQEIFDR